VKVVHERELATSPAAVGELLDDPSRMWPARWPPISDTGIGFLRHEPLGHSAGEWRSYRITAPRGLDATHGWDVRSGTAGGATLRHTVEGRVTGTMRIAWPLVVRPIHDALHEDVLDEAERAVGGTPRSSRWTLRVRALRWAIRKAGRS
jgi:hypothetical protein